MCPPCLSQRSGLSGFVGSVFRPRPIAREPHPHSAKAPGDPRVTDRLCTSIHATPTPNPLSGSPLARASAYRFGRTHNPTPPRVMAVPIGADGARPNVTVLVARTADDVTLKPGTLHSPLRCRCPLCEVNRRIGLHDSNGVAHACDSDTRCSRPSSVTYPISKPPTPNGSAARPTSGGNAVTDQHCSPRAVRTPVATRNLNPDVARSVAT
jgi:hypothetical protein